MDTGVWRRPLVVGASGQVGVELCHALEAGGAEQVLRSARAPQDDWLKLDLATLRSVEEAAGLLDALSPDLLICSGAMTFVDGCEDRPEEAYRANAYGPSMLASYARQRGIPFVFFSTDYVFDGTEQNQGPYGEGDATCPLSVYGRSKLEGERAVLRVYPEAVVIRTSWVYGPDAAGKNFISTLQRLLRAGDRMRVPSDQISTPTLNRDLAQAALELVKAGAKGLFHVTGPELLSRYELAQKVASFFSLDEGLIDGVPTASLGQRAARPLYSGLRSDRLNAAIPGFRMRSLEEGLQATAAAQGSMVAV